MEQDIRDFLFHCKFENNLSSKTLAAYEIDLRQFKTFCSQNLSIKYIETVNKEALKQYLENISPRFKPKTLKRKMASLKAFFNHLQFDDKIAINPFNKVRIRIKEGKRVPRVIDPKIIKRLYRHLYQKKEEICPESYGYATLIRDIAVLELLFSTGLRVSELSHLKPSSLSLNKSTIRILGKGDKERLIPICSPETKDALKEYFQIFKNKIEQADYFFINRLNRRFSEQSIRFMIKKYISAISIDQNITPHMFRHSLATMLLENEVDLRYIQDLLGHTSINTTQIYLSVNKKKQRAILSRKHPRRNF